MRRDIKPDHRVTAGNAAGEGPPIPPLQYEGRPPQNFGQGGVARHPGRFGPLICQEDQVQMHDLQAKDAAQRQRERRLSGPHAADNRNPPHIPPRKRKRPRPKVRPGSLQAQGLT